MANKNIASSVWKSTTVNHFAIKSRCLNTIKSFLTFKIINSGILLYFKKVLTLKQNTQFTTAILFCFLFTALRCELSVTKLISCRIYHFILFDLSRLKKSPGKMFMPFYYNWDSKCAENDLNPSLIGNCGHYYFSLQELELLFCGRLTEVLGRSANTSRAESFQTMALSYLCKLAAGAFNVPSANADVPPLPPPQPPGLNRVKWHLLLA